jgi:hypothetical protein
VAVASVGNPPPESPNDTGEVANSPTVTVDGRPVRWVVPIWVQVVPLVESSPVSVSPERVSRSHRGEPAVTEPGRPALSWM